MNLKELAEKGAVINRGQNQRVPVYTSEQQERDFTQLRPYLPVSDLCKQQLDNEIQLSKPSTPRHNPIFETLALIHRLQLEGKEFDQSKLLLDAERSYFESWQPALIEMEGQNSPLHVSAEKWARSLAVRENIGNIKNYFAPLKVLPLQ